VSALCEFIYLNVYSINKLVDYLEKEILKINDNLKQPETNEFDYLDELSHEELESLLKQEVGYKTDNGDITI